MADIRKIWSFDVAKSNFCGWKNLVDMSGWIGDFGEMDGWIAIFWILECWMDGWINV